MTVFRHVSRINVSLWGRRVGACAGAATRRFCISVRKVIPFFGQSPRGAC